MLKQNLYSVNLCKIREEILDKKDHINVAHSLHGLACIINRVVIYPEEKHLLKRVLQIEELALC